VGGGGGGVIVVGAAVPGIHSARSQISREQSREKELTGIVIIHVRAHRTGCAVRVASEVYTL
jgi:hypothetical protein